MEKGEGFIIMEDRVGSIEKKLIEIYPFYPASSKRT